MRALIDRREAATENIRFVFGTFSLGTVMGVVTLSSAGATSCTSADVRPRHQPRCATPRTPRLGRGGECEQRRDNEER
jgi:hypothetical protein